MLTLHKIMSKIMRKWFISKINIFDIRNWWKNYKKTFKNLKNEHK